MPKPSPLEYATAIVLGPRYGLDPWTAKAWPRVDELSSAERKAVVRSTRRGIAIGDPRLAFAVIDYHSALRDTRDRYFRVHETVGAGLIVFALSFAAYVLSYGYDATKALMLAVLTGLGLAIVAFVLSGWRGVRFTLARAERAEALARRL